MIEDEMNCRRREDFRRFAAESAFGNIGSGRVWF